MKYKCDECEFPCILEIEHSELKPDHCPFEYGRNVEWQEMSQEIKHEKIDGRYCNLESEKCRETGRVYIDNDGYICATCGGRVSKWLPVAEVAKEMAGKI